MNCDFEEIMIKEEKMSYDRIKTLHEIFELIETLHLIGIAIRTLNTKALNH